MMINPWMYGKKRELGVTPSSHVLALSQIPNSYILLLSQIDNPTLGILRKHYFLPNQWFKIQLIVYYETLYIDNVSKRKRDFQFETSWEGKWDYQFETEGVISYLCKLLL